MLVHGLRDPVDPGVAANLWYVGVMIFATPLMKRKTTYSFVRGVDEDDLVVLVHTVLVDPVRVEDTEVAAATADTLLSNATETALGLEVVDTLADGLAVGGTWDTS